MKSIHWVGGNLPQIGKSWMVRALVECLYLDRQISAVVIDTSPNSPLSQIYNPSFLEFDRFDRYFIDNLVADRIFNLIEDRQTLIIKLASYSQSNFLKWIEETKLFTEDIRHHFWFVTNGHRDSSKYFQEIARSPNWNLNWVRNHYQRTWQNSEQPETALFNICDLSGVITNFHEINYIEANRAILYHLAHPQAAQIPLMMRSRIGIFLKQSCDSLFANYPESQLKHEILAATQPKTDIDIDVNDNYQPNLDIDSIIERLPDDLSANLEEEDEYLPY
jgi:hypothetical protein